ncbi:MAG: N-acetyl-gamma-glutamyl-phosphate reductase [Trueperaceae bacterium]|nr:N-acetyl-gamma-glutamyl-phosphate reductase [Trueperaceae bacterium]
MLGMTMDRVKVGILGASGYGGADLLRRFAKHPHVTLSGIGSRQYEGQRVDACWPQLAGAFSDLTFQDSDAVIDGCDVLVSAAPHGSATDLVVKAIEAGKRVVDLSADFRLAPEDFERWYGATHPHPQHYPGSVYGLVELHRDEIRDATLVANPGCYPTASALALAPLAACGWLGRDVIVSAASGVSGAGRSVSLGTHYSELNENYKAYKIAGTHRHTAEIETTLGRVRAQGRHLTTHGDADTPLVSFNPHLVPMSRGILATCYTRPDTDKTLSDARLLELYKEFYDGEALITVQDDLPQTKATYGSDRVIISVRFDERTGMVVALAAEDNLGKGAAGQAIQNLNLMLGVDEGVGLEPYGVWP